MGAFDKVFPPKGVTPADTNETALFTAGTDSTSAQEVSVMVDVVNVSGAGTPAVKVGITPSGGSVHWKVFDVEVAVGSPLLGLGPWPLNPGDAITVQTDTANAVTFSITGFESSP
jgi:hypothetical protein